MSKQENKQVEKTRYIGKRIKFGVISTIVTIIFVVIVVLLNIIVSKLSDRYSLKLDITPQKYFEVSDETKNYLEKLSTDVEIVVLADESALSTSSLSNKYVVEVLYKYAKYSDNISLKFVDPGINPDYVSKYKSIYSGTINSGSIVITSGNRIKVLTAADILDTQVDTDYYTYYNQTNSIIAEQSLTSAIMLVSNENPVNVAILTTDLEQSGGAGYTSLLETNGYQLQTVDPSVGEIAADVDMLVVPAPLNDFTEATCKRIEDFLYNEGKYGRQLVYLANTQQNATPNIDALLETWGIAIEDGYVCEDDTGRYVNAAYNIITQLESNDYTALMGDASRVFASPLSCPLKALWSEQGSYTVTSLASTSDKAFVITPDFSEDTDIDSLPKQVFDLALLASRNEVINNEQCNTNVLVLSSVYCVDSSIIGSTAYSNGEYLLAITNKLTGNTETGVSIVSKEIEQYSITVTEAAAKRLKWIMVIGIPVALLVVGIVIWARRKNR